MDDAHRRAIAVAALVRVVQPRGRPGDHRQRQLERDPRALAPRLGEQRPEILAVDVLHRQEVDARVFTDLEHLRDVLVIQRRGESCLVEEHLHRGVIVRPLGQDHLEHHVALKTSKTSGSADVDPCHPTRGERREDLVLPEMGG